MRDLSRLEGRNFLVVGRAGMDFYADPPGTRTEVAGRFVACIGGSSANIAVALVKQGCQAALLTRVSDDAVGRFCLNELDRYGVDRSHVVFAGGEARTSLSVVETRLEDCQSVIYRNGAADFALTIDDVEAVDYGRFAAMIVTGTALAAEPSRGAVFRSIDVARRAGLPVILDIDYRPYSWVSNADAAEICGQAARLSDVIVGNDVEFGVLAGDARRGLDRARELVDGGAAIGVYKMGERGAVALTSGREIRTGIFRTEALKPTGAGDAFMGGFVAALSGGCDVEEAVLRGSASAAIVVSRVGCAPAMPTTDELEAFISARDGPDEN